MVVLKIIFMGFPEAWVHGASHTVMPDVELS